MASVRAVQGAMVTPCIDAMSVQIRDLELTTAFTTAQGTHQRRKGMVLRVLANGSIQGLGEASPLPGYSPETLDACLEFLQSGRLLSRAREQALEALPNDNAAPRDLQQWVVSWGNLLPHSLPSLRFGLETALIDLLAQRWKLSLRACLGRILDRPVDALPTVRSACLVNLMELEFQLPRLKSQYAQGHRLFKCKVGRPGRLSEELDRLTDFLRQMPHDVRLRLDGNGSLTVDALNHLLSTIAPERIEAIEEPWELLQSSPSGTPASDPGTVITVPILLDESPQRPNALPLVERLLRRKMVAGLVLKPTTLGGLFSCWSLASLAWRCGAYALVTHTHEGPIGFEACYALASQFPSEIIHGLDAHWISTYSGVSISDPAVLWSSL